MFTNLIDAAVSKVAILGTGMSVPDLDINKGLKEIGNITQADEARKTGFNALITGTNTGAIVLGVVVLFLAIFLAAKRKWKSAGLLAGVGITALLYAMFVTLFGA